MPDATKDFEFIMAILKTGSITVNYDAAGAMLGWEKRKCIKKMSEFRKTHDWPINKDTPAAAKGSKAKAGKHTAEDIEGEDENGDGEGQVKKPAKKPAPKRAKGKKAAKEEVIEDDADIEDGYEEDIEA